MGIRAERLTHKSIKNWLKERAVDEDCVELSWLGQAGFIIQSSECCIAGDVYLSDYLAKKYQHAKFPHIRMMQPPVLPEEFVRYQFDYMFSTHAHSDHFDPVTIKMLYDYQREGKSPLYVLPRAEGETALQRSVPLNRMLLINAREQFSSEGFSVQAAASAHETLETDRAGNSKYLGYVIEIGGLRIYHSGDGIPYSGLIEELSSLSIDIALLPVNGRDSSRSKSGIPGNFTIQEACTLVKEAQIPFWIPHHFHMFSFNTAEPAEISQMLQQNGFTEGNDWVLPESGKVYRFSKAAGNT